MYCGHCGVGLPDDARFCLSCGSPVRQVADLGSGPAEGVGDQRVFDDLERLFDQAARYREIARSGPVTDQLIMDGAAFCLTARRQCDELLSSPRVSRNADVLRHGVEMPEYQNAAALIALGRRLSVRDPAIKKMLMEIFPIYAEKGIDSLGDALARQFGGELSPDFSEELYSAHALKEHLDRLMFMILLEGMKRNKLRMQEHHFNIIMLRIGFDATKQAMDHVGSIKG